MISRVKTGKEEGDMDEREGREMKREARGQMDEERELRGRRS